MAEFNQYTTCSKPAEWQSAAAYLGWATAALTVIATPIIIYAGWCALFYLAVVAAAETVAFCDWWLNVRLVCLGSDRSAVGMLVAVEPARGKTELFGELDTDYSINLLLYPSLPGPPGVTQAVAEVTPPYGELIKEQQGIKDFVKFFRGESATEPNSNPPRTSAVLHAEFEGAGIRDFRVGALVALGLTIAALVACAVLPPPFGIIAGAILTFLAFLAGLIGYLVGDHDYGDPSDVEGAPSEFHTNDPNGVGGDLLYVTGAWVFDSLHEGWNEIHPIKACTRMGTWNGAWPADIPDRAGRFDNGFEDATNPATIQRQQESHYRWTIHPYIDGCGDWPPLHPSASGDLPPIH